MQVTRINLTFIASRLHHRYLAGTAAAFVQSRSPNSGPFILCPIFRSVCPRTRLATLSRLTRISGVPSCLIRTGCAVGFLTALLVGMGMPGFAVTNEASWLRLSWLSDDGLPNNTVTGIGQTPDGFLWLSAGNSLARFDGISSNHPIAGFWRCRPRETVGCV